MNWTGAIMAGLALATSAGAGAWITADHYGAVTIVLGVEPRDIDREAAERLQFYWEKVTGHRPDIVESAPEAGHCIWVGREFPAAIARRMDHGDLGVDGVYLKTVDARNLAITGGGERGVRHAVYQFLDDYLGVRWLSPEYIHYPAEPPAAIPAIDFEHVPTFIYRWSTYLGMHDPAELAEYRRAHRWEMGPGFACHSFYRYVDPKKYFESNPEYFSLVNGERVAVTGNYHDHYYLREVPHMLGQLCMSNPEVVEILTQQVRDDIVANPAQTVHHISQMDWERYCECDDCAALDEQEGTPMGSVMWALNQVAETIGQEHPGHKIETLAYWYTREPPKHMRPADNLIIKLCNIESDFFADLDDPDSKANSLFFEDIQAWAEMADHLNIWTYTTNFRNFQSVMPNFHVWQNHFQVYADHNVHGMFPQGSYDSGAEFAQLRAYLFNKLMWDHTADADAVMDEFIDLYYQEVAPFIREYIAMTTERVRQEDTMLGCFDSGVWFNYDMVEKAEELFQRAYDAVESDDVRFRLDRVYATVQYAALAGPPKMTYTEDRITLERPPSLSLEEYAENLKRLGVQRIVDFMPFDEFYDQIGNETPPRFKESTLVRLEDARSEVWIAPELEGSILRWRNKDRDIELLRGYETYGLDVGNWQEWASTPGVLESAIANKYEVIEVSDLSATLRATMQDGLLLDKTVTLMPNGVLTVSLSVFNPTGAPQTPNFKYHPEFYTQGKHQPAYWAQKDGQWVGLTEDLRPEVPAWGRLESAKGIERWLVALGEDRDVVILNDFEGDPIGQILMFFNIGEPFRQQANLEIIPEHGPLGPGERRTYVSNYRVIDGLPIPR